ncbi:PREDICTED: putative F-box/kelch-repeat protein At1g20790 [Tarenaya hassleriana]|uniref:putative F-box/kelch-repeat protein At1g20790 n=1 Tax=Tarenaya hassleriana TaxID=28532 RepID=UPI00053C794D|nr:PREDICTED: putative F-box/kelch-repeat protein At1g20790 [Tarenaya hassleriana]
MQPAKRRKTLILFSPPPPEDKTETLIPSSFPPLEELPSNVIDEILFKLPQKSLARLKCTCRTLRSHISNPDFESEYFSRVGPGLIHVSSFASNYLCFNPFVFSQVSKPNSESDSDEDDYAGCDRFSVHLPMHCQILASHGGLVLMFMKQLCIFNPITRQFRFLTHESSQAMRRCVVREPEKRVVHAERSARIGLVVEQIDRMTQMFKIVCVDELRAANPDESRFGFDIYKLNSWKKSKATVSCPRSNISRHTKPVYFNGALHWLRNNGSIIAFDPETEEAKLIPTTYPSSEPDFTVWLGAADGQLILILATEEVISVFSLVDHEKPDWTLVRSIKNDALDDGDWLFWSIVAYDGKVLVLQETKGCEGKGRVLHKYSMRDNKWGILGLMPRWLDANRDFCRYIPSWSSVAELQSWHSTFAAARQGTLAARLRCLGPIMDLIDPQRKPKQSNFWLSL